MKIQELQLNRSTDFYSNPINLEGYLSVSAQITTSNGTGGFNANISLQMNNDGLLWEDIPGSLVVLSGTADTQIYDVPQTSVSYVRVKVDITSGTADFAINWLTK